MLPDSQASLSDDSTSRSGTKRKPPSIVSAVVLSSNGMKKHIKEIVKHEIWRTRKFVNNQDQIEDVCQDIMEISDQLKPLWEDTKNRKAYIKSMAQNYGQTICSAINEKRSNIQSAVQKVYTKRFKDGLYMPTHNEFREIVMRRGLDYIDTEREEDETDEQFNKKLELAKQNERNRKIFVWYWLEVLPVSVSKDEWGLKMRFMALLRIMHLWIIPTTSTLPTAMRL